MSYALVTTCLATRFVTGRWGVHAPSLTEGCGRGSGHVPCARPSPNKCIHLHLHVYVYVYVCIHVYVYIYIYMCISYVYIYIYTHIAIDN